MSAPSNNQASSGSRKRMRRAPNRFDGPDLSRAPGNLRASGTTTSTAYAHPSLDRSIGVP